MTHKDIAPYWGPVLQGVSHWIAYKKQYFDGHLLLEGAIIAEVTQLLSSKLDNSLRLNCEIMYKDIFEQLSSQKRCDLVIYQKGEDYSCVKEVVEVKRFEISKKNENLKEIQKDMEKLSQLLHMSPQVSLYIAVFGQHKLPSEYFGPKGGLRRTNLYKGKLPLVATPIMSRRAINRSSYGGFGVLIEIEKT